ncbi:cytochrome c3 family protein [Desulfogranum japonicum]|uniref:cytochrome c3 family protein n=1 Tax=Desulfogranum japonicum TaxID=231447 RepID=UPI0004094002|nr:cytochrome c3 family protein [Desulfogranum japonicum]
MKKLLVCGAILAAFFVVGSGVSFASDKGPAEITLESTIDTAKKPKPATFPHAEHQSRLACGDCHHGKDADGKKIDYVEGQEIGKCESCHNKAAGMPKKVASYKDAAHALCKDCHKQQDAKLAKCNVCHK